MQWEFTEKITYSGNHIEKFVADGSLHPVTLFHNNISIIFFPESE